MKSKQHQKLEDRRHYVEYWDGSSSVGVRAEAVDSATADVVIFMERFPQTLWKSLCSNDGKENLKQIERELNLVTTFMKSRGFLHFDAHFHNILAGNRHVYFADFGLAISQEFNLSLEEEAFFQKHSDYDRCYVVAELARRVISSTLGKEKSEVVLDTYFSNEKMTVMLPSTVASIGRRYRPIAILMDKFFRSLREGSKSTPYPEAELTREWNKAVN
jgi:serine/threonine protein kinase